MKKSIRQIFNVFVCSTALVGMFFLYTEYNAYHYKPLSGPTSLVEPFKDSGVKIDAIVYSSPDSERYLHRDIKAADGYQPVQITIQNNTPNALGLGMRSIEQEVGSADSIVNGAILRSLPRAIGYKVASFFFWPFAIPATIDTIMTFHTQSKLRQDLRAKSIKTQEEKILPYSVVHRMIFLKKGQLDEQFFLHLKDYKSGTYRAFPVTINT